MADLVLQKQNEKFWISYIRQRIKKNKNFLGFISGQTGSGKSWSSLRIAEELDPEFKIDRCVFGGIELMNLINSGGLKRGNAIVFEEIGVEMNNRNWGSVVNKMLNYLLQTFRHRGFILIMNSPYMDFVDAGTRKLFHAELQTCGINFNKQQVRLKPQLLQYNSRMQKFYYKRLKVITPEGIIPVSFWNVSKPSDKLLEDYEQKKRQYTDNLNKRIYEELQNVQNKTERQGRSNKLTTIQQEVFDLLKQGLNLDQIAKERKRATAVIRENIRLIRQKGYTIKAVYDAGRLIRYDVEEPKVKA